MIEVAAGSAHAARERRRTWMLGGGLLAASALLSLAMRGSFFLPTVPFVSPPDVLFAAGAVVFAVGLGRSGSVTGRRPLGTSAVVGLAVWLLLAPPLLSVLQPEISMGADAAERTDLLVLSAMLSITGEVIALALAIVGVMQIGRGGVVPQPWQWAPLWALLAVVAVRVLRSGFLFGQQGLGQEALVVLDGTGALLEAVAVGFLGVLAMVLAARPSSGSTMIYSSGE
ncbi:hypothetical protein [Microbacterium sp.]|uniref:hypothetical protein n=1 Tax=Microbacterium sp. TaxID=51671 RepID=UPI003C776E17